MAGDVTGAAEDAEAKAEGVEARDAPCAPEGGWAVSAHTPGAWSVEPATESTPCHVYANDPNGCAADADLVTVADFINTDADARLIAAAPDLLAALKETLAACSAAMRVIADLDAMHLLDADVVDRQQRFIDECKVSGITNGFGVRVKDAIAKAEAL